MNEITDEEVRMRCIECATKLMIQKNSKVDKENPEFCLRDFVRLTIISADDLKEYVINNIKMEKK